MPKVNNIKSIGARPQASAGMAAKRSHEKSEIFLPGIIFFLLFMTFGGFVMHAGLWGWLKNMKTRSPGIQRNYSGSRGRELREPVPTFPKLQSSPKADWQSYRDEQEKLLHSYGWINRTAGVVRIPIDVAMARLLEHGVPRWSSNNRAVSPLQLQQERAGKGGQPIQ
jgi:hypothetical protein